MGTIAEKLTAVANSKADIASAITYKGGTVPTKFADYGDAIRALPPPSPTPPPSLITKSITQNGTYDASDDGADGYSEVTVNVSGGGGSNELFKKMATRQTSPTWTVSESDLAGATKIGESAFRDCTGLTSVTLPNTITEIRDYAFENSSISNFTIPSSVTSIGSRAFARCESLTSVTIPSGVGEIYVQTFYQCENLASVTIPNTVVWIDNGAFESCSALTSITIPNSVTIIDERAFYDTGLQSITIPNSVVNVGGYLFRNCRSLQSATIGSGLTEIPLGCFYDCISLRSVTIGSGVTSIGSSVFYNTGLNSITIPDNVTSIGYQAFSQSIGLTTIDFGTTRSSVPTLVNVNAFTNLPANYQILVPSALLTDWKAANKWNNSAIVDHIVAHP